MNQYGATRYISKACFNRKQPAKWYMQCNGTNINMKKCKKKPNPTQYIIYGCRVCSSKTIRAQGLLCAIVLHKTPHQVLKTCLRIK